MAVNNEGIHRCLLTKLHVQNGKIRFQGFTVLDFLLNSARRYLSGKNGYQLFIIHNKSQSIHIKCSANACMPRRLGKDLFTKTDHISSY